MSVNPSVVVRDLSKTYFLTKDGEEKGLTPKSKRIKVEALKPTSFVAYEGESVGIIGRNGSGKSTLFSLIAGNEDPTTGSVLVSAQPTLLSVAAALQPHLNAFDNAKLGLLAKGVSPSQAEELKHSIVKWADIGEAVNRPLSSYSSGMGARLKFAIATAVHSEILLVDEALATGDAAFTKRANARMSKMLSHASTIFLVTHSAGAIRKQCNRAIWLHEGEILADGKPYQVTQMYQKWSNFSAEKDRVNAGKIIRRLKKEHPPKELIFDSEAIEMLDNGKL